MKDKFQNNGLLDIDSVRKNLKSRNKADFSAATLRRLALFYQDREHQ